MLRAAGALAVFISCAAIGIYKSFRLKKRCDSLSALILCVKHIGAETAFSKRRIESILNSTAREFDMMLFANTAAKIKYSGVQKAWCDSLEEYRQELALSARDISAASTLGAVSDFTGEEQQKCIHTCERLLELALGEASEDYNRTAKLFRSGGILCGMLAVILLL